MLCFLYDFMIYFKYFTENLSEKTMRHKYCKTLNANKITFNLKRNTMAKYAISGVWKNAQGTITHYAVHEFNEQENSMELGVKMTKINAVRLLENYQNSAITILWNYAQLGWVKGTTINVVGTAADRYLRTTQDGTVRDNLGHLINYGLITNNFA